MHMYVVDTALGDLQGAVTISKYVVYKFYLGTLISRVSPVGHDSSL